jgi:hypothetical protein
VLDKNKNYMPDFNQLFDQAALDLYQSFEKSGHIIELLKERLPLIYGISPAHLVNSKKESLFCNGLIFNQLQTSKLFVNHPSTVPIIEVNKSYGNLFYEKKLDSRTLEVLLEKQEEFITTFSTSSSELEMEVAPLNIWFVEELEPFISLEDVEDRLLAEPFAPDLVLILSQGLLVRLNQTVIENLFALEQQANTQSFDKEIMANLVEITGKTRAKQYFKIGSNANYKNLFYFYIFLLDFLEQQNLPQTDLSANLVALWNLGK